MKKQLVLWILVCLGFSAQSQITNFMLHEQIGDSIDSSERLEYELFDGIRETGFLFAKIHLNGEKYYVTSFFVDDTITNYMPSTMIQLYRESISSRVAQENNRYPVDSSNVKSTILIQSSNQANLKVREEFTSAEYNAQMAEEAIRQHSLESSARNRGLRGRDAENFVNFTGAKVYKKEPKNKKK